MFKRNWQSFMIYLARSKRMTSYMQSNKSMCDLAKRYVGGLSAADAIQTALKLKTLGIDSSLFYLGEYVDTQELVEENMSALREITDLLASSDIDMHISIDPTQVGCSINWRDGCQNVKTLATNLASHSVDRKGVN